MLNELREDISDTLLNLRHRVLDDSCKARHIATISFDQGNHVNAKFLLATISKIDLPLSRILGDLEIKISPDFE